MSTEPNIHDWVFLLFPQPQPDLAEQRFRRKWLNTDNLPQGDGADLDEILWQVGSAISGLKDRQQPLTLSDKEKNYLADIVGQWAEYPPRGLDSHNPFPNHERIDQARRAIFGLRSILLAVSIPETTATKLYKKVQALKGSDTPGLGLIAGIVKALPDRADEIALLVRIELTSDNKGWAGNAIRGLYDWLAAASDSTLGIQSPPDELVREIGIVIATRRKVVLKQALQIAKWVFEKENEDQREIIGPLAIQGLGYLIEELRYDREHDQDNDFDVPFLRWVCTHLALAMAEHGLADDPTIARWLEIAKEDPLPEVRHAQHPARQRKEKESIGDEPMSQVE